MTHIISDGMVAAWWLTACANPAAPTVAEITAGVILHSSITPDGLDIGTTETMVDVGALDSIQDAEVPGRRKDDATLTFKYPGDAAAPWTTFAGRPDGFLVLRWGIAATTAIAAAQKVDVRPVRAGVRQRIKPAKNEVLKFSVALPASGSVYESVSVAA